MPGLFTFGDAENGEGTFPEAEGAWGEVREIKGDAVRFAALDMGCGDVKGGSMTAAVSVSMVMGEGGASSSAVEA